MKKETVKGSLSECVSFINKDIEGIKNNIIKALDEGNASAHDRWLKNLREALSVKKEYDWQLMYSVYETDGHKEIAIWEQDSECNIRGKITWKVKDDASILHEQHCKSDNYKYECDMKKRKLEDFESDFYDMLESDSKFLLDTSLYPRGCGKTTELKVLLKLNDTVVILVPSANIQGYKNIINGNEFNNRCIVVNSLDNLRGLRLHDKNVVCEEGFSIYEILKMRDMGINIQCALVNGVE